MFGVHHQTMVLSSLSFYWTCVSSARFPVHHEPTSCCVVLIWWIFRCEKPLMFASNHALFSTWLITSQKLPVICLMAVNPAMPRSCRLSGVNVQHLVQLDWCAAFLENEHGHPPPPPLPVLCLQRQEVTADWPAWVERGWWCDMRKTDTIEGKYLCLSSEN